MSALMLAIVMACSGKEEVVRDSGGNAPSGETGAGAVTDTADSGGAADSGDAAPLVCADGLNPAPLDHLTCANQSICRWPGTQTSGSLGYAIDVGGDVNGDGWADLLVGAPAKTRCATTWSSGPIPVVSTCGSIRAKAMPRHPQPACLGRPLEPSWVPQSPSFPT